MRLVIYEPDYKLVFLTDRTQLDTQLNSSFANTQGQSIYSAKNVKELSQLLKKDASDIVTGMMQKFREGSETEISGIKHLSTLRNLSKFPRQKLHKQHSLPRY